MQQPKSLLLEGLKFAAIAGVFGVAVSLHMLKAHNDTARAEAATAAPKVQDNKSGAAISVAGNGAWLAALKDAHPGNTISGDGQLSGPLICPDEAAAEEERAYVTETEPQASDPIASRVQFIKRTYCHTLQTGDVYKVISNDGRLLKVLDVSGDEGFMYFRFP